jgi:two-component system response regulator HydG
VYILFVGCRSSEREETQRLLRDAALEPVWADTTESALRKVRRREMPVLLDLSRGAAVIHTAQALRARDGRMLMLAVADVSRSELTDDAVVAGVADVLERPLCPRRVAAALEREGVRPWNPRRSTPVLVRGDLSSADLYCLSPSMRAVSVRIARAGAVRAGVTIRGESGSGRSVVARALHGCRSNPATFVDVDCAACHPDDLEREIFGVARDAVRGPADRRLSILEPVSRGGRLYQAIGGTCYLRHLAAAPPHVQARLAGVLSRGAAWLVETGQAIAMDMRPMAGVDPQFEQAVRQGRVRDDLHRSLSAITIDMPPLRKRREDIPPLANRFLRAICPTRGASPKTFSRCALALMTALPWSGNVSELREVVGHAAASTRGPSISLEAVLASLRFDGLSVVAAAKRTLSQAQAHFERDYIASIVEQHGGKVSEAARALGIAPTNLYRKLRRLRDEGIVVVGVRKYRSRHIA